MKGTIVTGANGFIGSSLIKILINKGVKVLAVDMSFALPRLPESGFITKIESGVDATLADKIPVGEYDAYLSTFRWLLIVLMYASRWV